MKRKLPRYVSEFQDRHGKWRLRFRRKGYQSRYINAPAHSPEFYREYAACMSGENAPPIEPGSQRRPAPGSVNALVAAFYRSPKWRDQADSTQRTYRGIIDRFTALHGEKPVALVRTAHLDAILGKMADRPAAANNLRKVLRRLFAYAVKMGMRSDNPAIETDRFKRRGEGFHTWTEDEIQAFQATHASGTRARLALELMLWTGQRRSDIIRLGRQHVKGDMIAVTQQKTGKALRIPIAAPLANEIARVPAGQMTFILTEHGKPFTPAGFGNWFKDRCKEAGLDECTAHGLRKAFSRRAAESGLTHSQGKAVTGHTKDDQFTHYAQKADQETLARAGMANLEARLVKNPVKPLKKKA